MLLVDRLEREPHGTRADRLRIYDLERRHRVDIVEEARTGAHDDRAHDDVELVQETGPYERTDEGRAAGDQDVLTGLLLELHDLDHPIIPADQRRVLPFERLQAVGDDVLRLVVHQRRDRISGLVQPVGSELLIGLRGQQEGVRLRHRRAYCLAYLLIKVRGVPFVRSIHDTIN